MSLNISGSKFVKVYDLAIKPNFSDKVLFANLSTSRRTGILKMNEETGAVVMNDRGEPVQERAYSRWQGRFVGNAFEPAKCLRNGEAINIISGWISSEKTESAGKTYINTYVTIAEFEPSNIEEGEDETSEGEV